MLGHAELHFEALVQVQHLAVVQLAEHDLTKTASYELEDEPEHEREKDTFREVGDSLRRESSVFLAHSPPSLSSDMKISSTEFYKGLRERAPCAY